MSALVLGFDVYGTLVDPLAMAERLRDIVGDRANAVAVRWRTTQIEYAFRRGLMRAYADFTTCTRQALAFACATEGVSLSARQAETLLEAYLHLPAYPEVANALDAVRASGARVLAFSNGTETAVRTVLSHAGLVDRFDHVVSVDPLRTFKPDPAVYAELLRRGGSTPGRTWLVSANGWDVIGAKHAGLMAAWVARSGNAVFDPWEFQPDAVARDLERVTEQVLHAGL